MIFYDIDFEKIRNFLDDYLQKEEANRLVYPIKLIYLGPEIVRQMILELIQKCGPMRMSDLILVVKKFYQLDSSQFKSEALNLIDIGSLNVNYEYKMEISK